jgi:hypothetical protein
MDRLFTDHDQEFDRESRGHVCKAISAQKEETRAYGMNRLDSAGLWRRCVESRVGFRTPDRPGNGVNGMVYHMPGTASAEATKPRVPARRPAEAAGRKAQR